MKRVEYKTKEFGEILEQNEDIYIRAEDEWEGWEDFRGKCSFEGWIGALTVKQVENINISPVRAGVDHCQHY